MKARLRSMKAEQAWVQDRESVLRAFDALGQGVTVIDENGRFEYANSAYARFTGRSEEALVGLRPQDVTPPEDRSTLDRAWERRQSGQTTSYECRIVRPDGTQSWVWITGVPRLREGRMVGAFAVVTDLTAQRHVEDTLRRVADGVSTKVGEEFFQSLVEQLALVTGADYASVAELCEEDRDCARTVTVWARGAIAGNFEYQLTGTPCENVIQGDLCTYPEGIQDRFPADLMLVKMAAEAYVGIPLLDSAGVARGLMFLIHRRPFEDVAMAETMLRIFAARASAELERRRSEERLLQSRKLESIGRLAGGVAHDFNNVLTAILGNVEQAVAQLPADHPVQEELEWIRKAGERAAGLTRQLQAFGRRQPIRPRQVDLNALVRETEKLLEPVMGEHIEVTSCLQPDLWPVRVDPGQIQQVLLNLAANARDAMPSGGRLNLMTAAYSGAVSDGGDDVGDWLLLTVSDTGTGMTEEQRAHAFDPFYTTKGMGEGSGLGLASCHGIVVQSHGHIRLASAPGAGTTVHIYLPVERDGVVEPEPDPVSHDEKAGSETILLVEDEALVRAPLVRTLRRQGYQVLEASDGRQAEEMSAQHPGPIELLITDIVMPRMGGREVDASLRDQRPDLRTLFMSGYSPEEPIETRDDVALLAKPFRATEFLTTVRDLLDR